nr:CMF_HP1_G0048620.mRNA.1.CDS.1 [Saccharomyces cerevisiae]
MERPEKGLPSSIVNEGAAGRVSWFVDDDALKDVFVIKKKYKFYDDENLTE